MDRGRAYSYIFDLKERQVTVLDHAFRSAEIRRINGQQGPQLTGSAKDVKLKLEKTGQTHAIKHWRCEEYKLQSDTPAMLGQDKVNFRLSGAVWLAAKTPEQEEMASLKRAAESPEYLLGLPSSAKVSADQALAIGETLRQLTSKGVLCGMDVEASYDGNGRMVELARKMAARIRIAFEDFTIGNIPAEYFAVPAGYRVSRY